MIDQSQAHLIRKDLDNYTDLDTVAATAGGKLIIDSFTKDVVSTVITLANSYKKLTHAEFVALAASLSANLDLIHTLTRAEKNKELAEEALRKALIE